jgi:hypothetical protein
LAPLPGASRISWRKDNIVRKLEKNKNFIFGMACAIACEHLPQK